MHTARTIATHALGWALLHTCALILAVTLGMFVHMEAPKESVHRPDVPGHAKGW